VSGIIFTRSKHWKDKYNSKVFGSNKAKCLNRIAKKIGYGYLFLSEIEP